MEGLMNVITNVNFGKEVEEPVPFEPDIIDCQFLTGCMVKIGLDAMEFTGWHDCEGEASERRIKVRFAMPRSAAIALYKQIIEGVES
jgi:hypothetical protein